MGERLRSKTGASGRFLLSALLAPRALLRRLINFPTALVDMMERHGVDR